MVNGVGTTFAKCSVCGTKIVVNKKPHEIRWRCPNCGETYGCNLRGDRNENS